MSPGPSTDLPWTRAAAIRRTAARGLRCAVLISAACLAACAVRPRRTAAPKPLLHEARVRVDREYYEAVEAYLKADYSRSRALISQITAVDPANAEARALLRRVKAAERLSAP